LINRPNEYLTGSLKLIEAEGKQLFKRFGVPIPVGYLAKSTEEVIPPTRPMVVKAQVRSGGRGKAGGIRFASTAEQARKTVSDVLSMTIAGEAVKEVLVEERLNILREFYLSISMDRSVGLPMILAVSQGGMEVEEQEGRTATWHVHPFVGLRPHVGLELGTFFVLNSDQSAQIQSILSALWRLFWEMDCELVEINPLALTVDGRLVAADAKVTLDDDALFRHPEAVTTFPERTPLELEADRIGLTLVQLDGDIGVIANGAGLTMATLDNLAIRGGRGGVFLDLGGTDDEKVVEAALALLSRSNMRAVMVNIFGGITRCDTVAEGIIRARAKLTLDVPLVVRIRGVNEEKAAEMLAAEGVKALHDLDEACQTVIEGLRRSGR